MTREQIAALVDKVGNALPGHDSYGSTGDFVVHLSAEERDVFVAGRDAIVAALTSAPMERPSIADIDPVAITALFGVLAIIGCVIAWVAFASGDGR